MPANVPQELVSGLGLGLARDAYFLHLKQQGAIKLFWLQMSYLQEWDNVSTWIDLFQVSNLFRYVVMLRVIKYYISVKTFGRFWLHTPISYVASSQFVWSVQ